MSFTQIKFSSVVFRLCVIALWIGIGVVSAQSQCRDDIKASDGYTVRSVRIESRWGWAPPVSFSIKEGDAYDPSKVLAELESVKAALQKEKERQDDAELQNRGSVSVMYITSCVRADDKTKQVDLLIQPYFIRLNSFRSMYDLLPQPRSNRQTFLSQVPKPLLALAPTFGVDQDKTFGTSSRINLATDLLDLPKILRGERLSVRKTQLKLNAEGRKSLDEPFYESELGLSFVRRRLGKFVESVSLESGFAAGHKPQGDAQLLQNTVRFAFGLRLRPGFGLLKRAALDAAYRRATSRFSASKPTDSVFTPEQAFEGRLVLEGRIAGGFTRTGLWFDTASPDRRAEPYRRLAGIIGYEKELVIAPNQSIGVEAVFGGGRAWGNVPEYARFYGGNTLNSFLFEPVDSPALKSFPAGPLIRSFGKGNATTQTAGRKQLGGTAYWHANLNVTIPVRAWSFPLIPDININDEDNPPISLKKALKNQVGTAESYLVAKFIDQGLSDDEARAEAGRIFRDVRPAMTFIADQANLFSVKPLVMFDAANIRTGETTNNKTRIAFGAGLQFTVVVARFEVGYMRSVRRLESDSRGNFIFRLTFQNLF